MLDQLPYCVGLRGCPSREYVVPASSAEVWECQNSSYSAAFSRNLSRRTGSVG
jgi:hypothetical protein